MAPTDPEYQLNMSEIADAVNRSGFGNTQRARRELMRLGSDDPDAFKNKYSDFLFEPPSPVQPLQVTQQQQQQVNIPTQQQQDTPYSFFDYNNPTSGYSIQNLGRGTYNILDGSGSVLGKGYKSLEDTIKDLQQEYTQNYNALLPFRPSKKEGLSPGLPGTFDYPYKKEVDPITGEERVTDQFDYSYRPPQSDDPLTQMINEQLGLNKQPELPSQFAGQNWEDVMSKYLYDPINMPTEYSSDFLDTGGDLGKWEIIGNLLQGQPISMFNGANEGGRGFLGDAETEQIRGLNSLFGSSPVLKDGQFKGYKMNLGPLTSDVKGYVNPFTARKQDLSGDTQSDSYLYRDINELDQWKNLAQKFTNDPNDYNVFVDKANAGNLPGWDNKSGYQYHSKNGGLFGNNILNTILPLAVGLFAPPLGAALGGLNSLAQTGTGFGALSAGLGASGIFNQLGPALGVSTQIGNQIGSAGLNTLFDTVQGKDFNLAKLGSNLAGSLAGSTLGNALGNTDFSKVATPAAEQAVKYGLYDVLSKRRKK